MIPSNTYYPASLDTDANLCLVHDSLRLQLANDYNPGDTQITTVVNPIVGPNFPPEGFITLTEQCSDLDLRAISFYYGAFDSATGIFSNITLLPEFTDCVKPQTITNVTMEVFDKHHNNLKDALIALQGFAGKKGTIDTQPFGPTLEGRINFLRQLVLQPKAWFTSDVQTGNVPLEVEFENLSFRLATDGLTDNFTTVWDFGDHSSSTISIASVISAGSVIPASPVDVLVQDNTGTIKKIYYQPGIFDVKLTVSNDFGSDTILFEKYINARVAAPSNAIIQYIQNANNQMATAGAPPDGPFETPPTIRSPINTLIQIEVPSGENPGTPGVSYGGELLNGSGDPIDPIVTWTWALGDDLNHPSSPSTKASYSVGGIYNLKLRVDTQFGAYRITSYEDSIDIVENTNLWLWVFSDTNTAKAYEFGLISETFKLANAPSLVVQRNGEFLTGVANEGQQLQEFNKNVGFAPRSTTSSGQGGPALLYWASGRNQTDPVTSEQINVVEFNGFTGTYITRPSLVRQWNWANLNAPQNSYFLFGAVPSYTPNTSPTNLTTQSLDLTALAVSTSTLELGNFLNGAQELMQNVSIFDQSGNSVYGNFSVYRTAWQSSTGYILRNDGVGAFFRLKSFYRTEGTAGTPIAHIRKLQDIQGPTKLEGELVPLSQGIYLLNNSGSVSVFGPTTSAWTSGGPGVNSLLYRTLQDTTVVGFDSPSNTLLAASDGDHRAYLSFDYSPNAFLKFNEIDLTFSTLGSRPAGEQFLMGIY